MSYLKEHPDPTPLATAARRLIFLKGRDAHDYKFSSAVLEDYSFMTSPWRDRYLAASSFHLKGSEDPDNELVKRTRAGALRSSELSDATITVTNLGDQGVESVFGVIYPPQVALVGNGRIVERAWAEDGALRAAPVVTATLAADHRVSDGHRGARFLAALRERLQRPEEL